MHSIKNKILLLFLTVISHHLFSQTINPENLTRYLDYIENNNLGVGSVSVFKDGKKIYSKHFGQKNIRGQVYNDATQYHVGSVTKLITATLILRLIEEGKLNIDDKLSDFYPEMPNSRKISIKNLLGHTSGLGSYVVKDGEVWVTGKASEKEILEVIKQQGVSFEPGEKVAYSNTAYYLLAGIVEKEYKMPFDKVFSKEIARPLKLKHFSSVKSAPKNVFKPYQYKAGRWQELEAEIDFLNVIGVGDMTATPKDLNIFINGLFKNKILKKETLQMMIPIAGQESWGRGLAVWDFEKFIFLGHGGDTLGSHAILMHSDDNNLSVAYTTNGERIRKEEFMKYIVFSLYNKDFKFPEVK